MCNFTCISGFGIVGSSSLTCGGDGSSPTGSYDNVAPTCEGWFIFIILIRFASNGLSYNHYLKQLTKLLGIRSLN